MIAVLKNTCLFKGVQENGIKEILEKEKYFIKEYKKGEIIASQGELCSSLSVILEGKAIIETIYRNGKVLTLSTFKVSDVFAEALIFAKTREYPATVMAVENSKILSFPKETMLNIMKYNSKFAENILELLSQKVVILNRKINLIELDTIRKKVCKLLLDNHQKTNSYNMKIDSKKDVAKDLGVERPSLSRELIKMKKENLIDFNLKEIKILDLERIEEEFFN